MNQCGVCGESHNPLALFCGECGTKLITNDTVIAVLELIGTKPLVWEVPPEVHSTRPISKQDLEQTIREGIADGLRKSLELTGYQIEAQGKMKEMANSFKRLSYET